MESARGGEAWNRKTFKRQFRTGYRLSSLLRLIYCVSIIFTVVSQDDEDYQILVKRCANWANTVVHRELVALAARL
jgi:succinate dehydrogenase hydrophobic anchor subunit